MPREYLENYSQPKVCCMLVSFYNATKTEIYQKHNKNLTQILQTVHMLQIFVAYIHLCEI